MHSYIYTSHALMPFFVRGTKQIWHHTILPAMEKEPDESAADFSSRVQKAVADHLGIKCSNGELVQEFTLIRNDSSSATNGFQIDTYYRSRDYKCKKSVKGNWR